MAGFQGLGLNQLGNELDFNYGLNNVGKATSAYLLNAIFGSKDKGFDYSIPQQASGSGFQANKFQVPASGLGVAPAYGPMLDTSLNATGTGGIGINPAQKYNQLGGDQDIVPANQQMPQAAPPPESYKVKPEKVPGVGDEMNTTTGMLSSVTGMLGKKKTSSQIWGDE